MIEHISNRLLRAARFAAEHHRDQRRKDTEKTPYINHPLEVAALLDLCGVTDDVELQAALLHDVVEDTEVTLKDLARLFGPRVAGMVGEVTDDKTLPLFDRRRLQVEHALTLTPGARRIKVADKVCNVRDIIYYPPSWSFGRQLDYVRWSRDVVHRVRHAAVDEAEDFCLSALVEQFEVQINALRPLWKHAGALFGIAWMADPHAGVRTDERNSAVPAVE